MNRTNSDPMKKFVTASLSLICSGLLIAALLFLYLDEAPSPSDTALSQEQIDRALAAASEEGESGKTKMKKARYDYFFRMLRDPATNSIPQNIRAREIRHAKTMPSAREVTDRYKAKNPTAAIAPEFSWELAGPPAVGGRTRALGIDQQNPNIIIAGGVSGGIWKSTDGGESWDLKNGEVENFSVTSLAQDPTDPDVWYYTSGEFLGQTAADQGLTAPYWGDGVYKSTDNGESWSLLPNASSTNDQLVDRFNTVSRIKISPTTGSIFIASNGFGIYKSTDDGNNFPSPPILGTEREQYWADIDVGPDGRLVATISSQSFSQGSGTFNPGVFVSYDDGASWDEITPASFPSNHGRSVITLAPSNPDIAYVLTQKVGDATNQGVSFHRINLATETAEDRSANLPNYGDPVGTMSLQNGYNMLVAVKPDDPDYVFVGGINLFRSTDGFATQPAGGYDNDDVNQKNQYWIGGYDNANNVAQYPNQHADQHVIAFDPTDPNRMWTGTDGGVSVTEDVRTSPVSWEDQNEGYIVTQFYAAAIPESPDDTRFMGGTQDNGTPFFNTNNPLPGQTFDISSGDGGYSFFTENFLFVSSQQGRVIRWNSALNQLNFVFPSGVTREELLFINPYVVDPNDENVMYYADVEHIWRNTSMDQINDGNSTPSGTSTGWGNLNSVNVPQGYIITAMEVSNAPADILYYAGSTTGQAPPVIRKLENARTNLTPEEIDLPNVSGLDGAYVHEIAVNPVNGNELMVILSNYGVPSIWHSSDGGNSWTNVEGNLSVQSIRSVTIIPGDEGMVYVVGTSTGIYSTRMLEGTATEWGQEGIDELGFSVVDQVVSRISNGDVAAGTHGRGMFLGSFQGSTSFPFVVANPAQAKAGETISITAANFTFSSNLSNNEIQFQPTEIKQINVCVNQNIDPVPGRVLSVSPDQSTIQVEVPAGILPDECAVSNAATITASVQGQDPDPAPIAFSVLPPDDSALDQNYPNPFNPSTTIPINLAVDSRVTLTVYDMLGQKVIEPVFEDEFIAGSYTTRIDLSNLASGVYLYRIVARPLSGNGNTFTDTRKMTLIK